MGNFNNPDYVQSMLERMHESLVSDMMWGIGRPGDVKERLGSSDDKILDNDTGKAQCLLSEESAQKSEERVRLSLGVECYTDQPDQMNMWA